MSWRFDLNSIRDTRGWWESCAVLTDQKLRTPASKQSCGEAPVTLALSNADLDPPGLVTDSFEIRETPTPSLYLMKLWNLAPVELLWDYLNVRTTMVQDLQCLMKGPRKKEKEKKKTPALKSHFAVCNVHIVWHSQSARWNIPKWPNFAESGGLVRRLDGDVGRHLIRGMNHNVTLGRERVTGARHMTTGRVWIIEFRFTAYTLWECRGERALITLVFKLCMAINVMNCFTMTQVEQSIRFDSFIGLRK